MKNELLFAAKYIAAGLSTISIAGAGVGIGLVFSGFLQGLARNPSLVREMFTYTLLGFALCEAIALFGLTRSWISESFF